MGQEALKLEGPVIPFVSIIIPCRNEEQFLGRCLDSILANDYPCDRLEVLVADGMSEDGTRAIVERFARKHPFIRWVENPRKIQAAALNIGIAQARGDIIMRLDAHSTYHAQYVSRCVKALIQYGADNVGGVWKVFPRRDNIVERAVARSLTHPFGIGNATYRFARQGQPRWVDTVPFFCMTREGLRRLGPFSERVGPSEDMEFSNRLRKAGGRILLVPDIICYYYARSDPKSFLKHNWRNGLWTMLPFSQSSSLPVAWRHLVPLAFVLSLGLSGGLALMGAGGGWLLLAIAGAYGLVNLAASVQVAWRERDLRYLGLMPLVFAALHLSYGLGSLWGLVQVLGRRRARPESREGGRP